MSDVSLEAREPRRRHFRYDPSKLRGEEVYRDARRHTGLVRWLKIILPALAGAGVVAFFVAIKTMTSDIADLFTLASIAVDSKNLIMEKPHLSGFKGTEHSYEVHAERAVQDLTNPKVVRLEMIDAEFGLTSEVRVSLDATAGVFDGDKETLELSEGITVSSTDGYAAKLEMAMVDLRAGTLVSEGAIEISSTDGLVRSRALSISDRGKKIAFTGGVSMTFVPPEVPEASGETILPAAESE
jgi:lipopolysaccharide export system protein LptC